MQNSLKFCIQFADSLFYKKAPHSAVFLAVYVGDILLTRNDENEIQNLKAYLDETFKIKDLGLAHYFLGLEVLSTSSRLVRTQKKFVKEMLAQFGEPHSSPVTCPLDMESSYRQMRVICFLMPLYTGR